MKVLHATAAVAALAALLGSANAANAARAYIGTYTKDPAAGPIVHRRFLLVVTRHGGVPSVSTQETDIVLSVSSDLSRPALIPRRRPRRQLEAGFHCAHSCISYPHAGDRRR